MRDVANHVAITTLALERRQPVLMYQTKRNLVGAGTIAACGSGSMDWRDLDDSESRLNFLSVVRYAMARELCEEGKLANPRSASGKTTCRAIARNTKVIGFFRWVDRCGNPEFLGITRLEATQTTQPDRQEVWSLHGLPDMRMDRLADVDALLRRLESYCAQSRSEGSSKNVKLSLSCYMVLRRLSEIADYENSRDPAKQRIFTEVSAFLWPRKGK